MENIKFSNFNYRYANDNRYPNFILVHTSYIYKSVLCYKKYYFSTECKINQTNYVSFVEFIIRKEIKNGLLEKYSEEYFYNKKIKESFFDKNGKEIPSPGESFAVEKIPENKDTKFNSTNLNNSFNSNNNNTFYNSGNDSDKSKVPLFLRKILFWISDHKKPVIVTSIVVLTLGIGLGVGIPVGLSQKAKSSENTVTKFKITWKLDDNSIWGEDSFSLGEKPSPSKGKPTKKNKGLITYTFKNWVPEICEVKEDATYVANFTEITNYIKLSYNLNGGTTSGDVSKKRVKEIRTTLFPFDVTKEGYTFIGWSYKKDLIFDNEGNLLQTPEVDLYMEFEAEFAN